MKHMRQYLLNSGGKADQIISMNFESMEYRGMDEKGFYNYEKVIIERNTNSTGNIEGIKIRRLIDFLLE